MYTGIVQEVGYVVDDNGPLVVSAPDSAKHTRSGAAICIAGVGLSVTEVHNDLLHLDVSQETRRRTTAKRGWRGCAVNVETPLHLGDPVAGHLV